MAGANLKLDIKKCDFAVKRARYLRFISTMGEGISVDPEKKIAIENG